LTTALIVELDQADAHSGDWIRLDRQHFLLIRRLKGMIDLVAKGALKVAVPIQEPAKGA
jgi:hypothetical protein